MDYLFAATNMDYLGLQDTRQTKREGQTIAATIRELLPPGTLVLQAPITKLRPSDPAPIGGQLVILSHRWSHQANHWYADPTGRGLLTGITISNAHTKIRLLSTYWPIPHAENQHLSSLHAHVVSYLHQHLPLKDFPDLDQTHPLTYIQDLIMRDVHKHQRNPTHQTLLMGDLNSSWTNTDRGGAHPALQTWAQQMGWNNPSRSLADAHTDLTIRTNWAANIPISWIDHILTYRSPTTPTLLGAHLARSPNTISDKHRLFWNSYRIPGGPPQPRQRPIPCPYHRKKRKVPNIFRDKHTTAEYQTRMEEWFSTHPCPSGPHLTPATAGQYLQQVSEASTKVGLGGIKWKHKQWRSYRDGWTPHMLANQAQYHFLLKVQRHLHGQHGYTKWSTSHAIPNICNLTFPWEEAIHKAFCGDKDPEAWSAT